MVNYKTITVWREGELQEDDMLFKINSTSVNGELTRVACAVMKQDKSIVGNIIMEHGRVATEIITGENSIALLTKFNEIVEEAAKICKNEVN